MNPHKLEAHAVRVMNNRLERLKKVQEELEEFYTPVKLEQAIIRLGDEQKIYSVEGDGSGSTFEIVSYQLMTEDQRPFLQRTTPTGRTSEIDFLLSELVGNEWFIKDEIVVETEPVEGEDFIATGNGNYYVGDSIYVDSVNGFSDYLAEGISVNGQYTNIVGFYDGKPIVHLRAYFRRANYQGAVRMCLDYGDFKKDVRNKGSVQE